MIFYGRLWSGIGGNMTAKKPMKKRIAEKVEQLRKECAEREYGRAMGTYAELGLMIYKSWQGQLRRDYHGRAIP